MSLRTLIKQVRYGQIFATISEVSPHIRDKSCQKRVTIGVISRSILLSYCQISMTITIPYVWSTRIGVE